MTENKTPSKTPAKLVVRKASVARKPATAKVTAKPEKKIKKEKKVEGKIKVVRDSFTMPQTDYDLIAAIKQKALTGGLHVKKSELLRAGLHTLSKLSSTQLKQTVSALEKIKTGRPKKS